MVFMDVCVRERERGMTWGCQARLMPHTKDGDGVHHVHCNMSNVIPWPYPTTWNTSPNRITTPQKYIVRYKRTTKQLINFHRAQTVVRTNTLKHRKGDLLWKVFPSPNPRKSWIMRQLVITKWKFLSLVFLNSSPKSYDHLFHPLHCM